MSFFPIRFALVLVIARHILLDDRLKQMSL